MARLGAMTVVPGAVGAWRKKAIAEVGGYPPETLAEDQDLTIAVQRAGWRVAYDQSAIAWTEAPAVVPSTRPPALPLGVRHDPMRRGSTRASWPTAGRAGLAFVGLPQTILFQLLFALISPIIDLALVVNIFWTVSSIQEHGYTAMKGDLYQVALVLDHLRRHRPHCRADRFCARAAGKLAFDRLAAASALRLPTDHVLRRHQGRRAGASRATRRLVIHRAIRESCSRRSCTLTLSRGCPHVSGTLPRLAFQIDTDMSAHRTRGNPQKTGQLPGYGIMVMPDSSLGECRRCRAGWVLL